MARRRERDEDELSAPSLSNAIFAGEDAAVTLAEQGITGPQQAIALARQLKAKGFSRNEIHRQTSALLEGTPYAGVVFGPKDKKPRFEISDDKARFKPEGMPVLSKARLGAVLDHPELYKAVPSVGMTRIERSTTAGVSGIQGGDIFIDKEHVKRSGGRQTFTPEAMGPTLHEIQHDVQGKHGLNQGGSPDDFAGLPYEMQKDLYRAIDGENEAEMTRAREKMTPAQRRATPPEPMTPWKMQIDVEAELADSRRQAFIGDLADVATDAWKRLTTREVVEGRPIHQRRLDPRKSSADPAAFQFKSGGDASGVTDRLKGVKEWDALAAGKQIVYERANGERVIADGHQRRGLALRAIEAGQKGVMLDAYVLREKDGWSTRDVRAYAALKNMKESSGNPLDMAKVMRERPDLAAKSLPMSDNKIRDAVALSKLSPAAFDLVESGVVKAEHAAPVGAQVKDTGRHADLLTEMAKAGMRSAEHARLYVSQAMAAPSISETTGSLFGDETKVRSLLAERAKVLDRALGALKSDKRIFAMLEREAANIETAGNRLAHASNLERADTAGRLAELVERLSTTRGPVSEMLDRAAMAMAEGKTPAQAARGFVTDVGKTMKGGGINALTGDMGIPMSAPVDPNQNSMFGEDIRDPTKNPGWSAEAREASAKTRKGKAKGRKQMMIEDDGGKAAPHGDLMAEIAEMKRARTYAESAIKDAMAQPNTRLSVKRGDLTTVLTRDPNGNGFRVTTLRGNEPFGHRDYPLKDGDMRWLVDDMMSGGLKPPRKQMMIEDGSPKPSKDIVADVAKGQNLAQGSKSTDYSRGWKDAKSGIMPRADGDPTYMAGYDQYAIDKSPRAAERAMVQYLAKEGEKASSKQVTLAGKTMPENGKPKGSPRLIGIPADGSKPFTMAILDGAGDASERGAQIFNETQRLYTQKLSGYRVEGADGVEMPKGQTSFLPDATTKEQLAAAAKAKGRPSAGQQGMDDGLFGSGMNQTDLVEMAKHSAALTQTENTGVRPVTPADVAKENARREAARKATPYTPPAPHGPLDEGVGKPAGWSDAAREASATARAPKKNKAPKTPKSPKAKASKSDPFAVNLTLTAQRDGRFAIQDALDKMSPKQVRAAAKAQGIYISASTPDADVKMTTVKAAFTKVAERIAAAGGDASKYRSEIAEIERNMRTASKVPKAEDLMPGVRSLKSHADALFSAGTDRAKFDAAVSDLKSSGASLDDINRVMRDYANRPTDGTYEFKERSKDKALRAITRLFIERSQADDKASIINRLTGKPGAVTAANDMAVAAASKPSAVFDGPDAKPSKASRAAVKQEIAHLDSRIDNARASLSIGRPTAEDIARTDKLIADLEQQKSGLRGTQNAANREAIIKNRKANAKGKPGRKAARAAEINARDGDGNVRPRALSPELEALKQSVQKPGAAAQANAELAARKEKVRKGTKVSGEATLAALNEGAKPKGKKAKAPRKQMFIAPAAPAKAAPASAPVTAKPTALARAGHAFNVAGTAGLGVGIAAAAVIAANESAKAGESTGKQAAAAATAATVAAAPAAVVGGGLYAAAKWGGKTAAKAVPIVGWGIAAAAAAHGAYTEGMKASAEGKGAGGIAKAAGWGAVNSVVPIDAAVEASRGVRGRLSSGQAKQFQEANAAYQRDQQIHTTQTDHSDRKPGFGPEARIAAAKARGVALPYGGDPSKAPGYIAPKTYNGKLA